MPEVPSFQELYTLGRSEVETRNPALTDWEEGSINDVLVGLCVALVDGNYGKTIEEFRKTFVLSAKGQDLTDLAKDHYDIDREPATASQVTVRLTRATTAAGDVNLTTANRFSTEPDADGVVYDFSPMASAVLTGTTLDVLCECTVTGPGGNVAAATVVVISASLSDSSVTITNPAAAAGGNVEEPDEDLRARIYETLKSFVRGTKAAIELGAKQVAGVAMAHLDSATATLYVADSSGSSSAGMITDVLAELENWQAVGPNINVDGVALDNPAIDLNLTYDDGVDQAAVGLAVRTAVVAFVNSLGIADGLLLSDLIVVAKRIPGVKDVTVVAPAANVPGIANTLLRIALGDVAVS